MTELLAPAGNMEALKAAIVNGADAVYVGGSFFSARAYAENFSDEELTEAIRLTHFYGKKLYLAVNTLLNDGELPEALEYIAKFYEQGLDALIVQDIGLLYLLRQAMPELPIHASTQMTAANAASVRFLAEQGVERVILARELSLAEVRAVNEQTEIDLEIFVHGALCVCYSGQCLMSSMIGGRSGNRGRCAQPCRMAYTLTDIHGDTLSVKEQGPYLLSPRDLLGYWAIEDLHELGLSAWKIEGRMKKPEYVATVCRIYSEYLRLLDARRVIYQNEEDQRQLLQMFNRDFSEAYWRGNPGASLISYKRPNNRGVFLGRIIRRTDTDILLKLEQPLCLGDGLEIWVTSGGRTGCDVTTMYRGGSPVQEAHAGEIVSLPAIAGKTGDRVFKTYDKKLSEAARRSYEHMPEKELHFTLTAQAGQALELAARDEDGYSAKISSAYVVERALNSVSDWQNVRAQLSRLGGSGYRLGQLDGDLEDGVMLPASVLNNCRRDLVAAMAEQRLQRYKRRAPKLPRLKSRRAEPRSLALSALIDDAAMAIKLIKAGITEIYMDTAGLYPAPPVDGLDWPALNKACREAGGRLILSLPHIIRATEEDAWQKRIARWQEQGIIALRVNHCGQLALARQAGWQGALLGGPGLNIYNSQSLAFFSEQGLERLTLSPELNEGQLTALAGGGAEKELLAQGALPLMVSEHCPLGALLGGHDKDTPCSAPCKTQPLYALRDEKGYLFPCKSDAACRLHIFNSRELCLLEDIPTLRKAGVERLCLDLRLYEKQVALRLAGLYRLALGDEWEYREAMEKLPQIVREYTKGHLHRGV